MQQRKFIISIFICFILILFNCIESVCKEKNFFIEPHTGYGNTKEFYVEGRLYYYNASLNKIKPYKKTTALVLYYNGLKKQITSNKNGIFFENIAISEPDKLTYGINNPNFVDISLNQDDQNQNNKMNLVGLDRQKISNAKLLFIEPSVQSNVLVISDIDDTVTQKQGTDLLNILSTNPNKLKARNDVSKVYNQLLAKYGMIFYVTARPLYSISNILEFYKINNIPIGTIFSQNKGILACYKNTVMHKIESISKIINTYPEKKLILIGDNRFRDEQIYSKINEKYPNKVLKIFIFKVKKNKKHFNNLENYIDEPNQILEQLNF